MCDGRVDLGLSVLVYKSGLCMQWFIVLREESLICGWANY